MGNAHKSEITSEDPNHTLIPYPHTHIRNIHTYAYIKPLQTNNSFLLTAAAPLAGAAADAAGAAAAMGMSPMLSLVCERRGRSKENGICERGSGGDEGDEICAVRAELVGDRHRCDETHMQNNSRVISIKRQEPNNYGSNLDKNNENNI